MSFETLGLIEPLIRALNERSYKSPTDIQAKTIPIILKGQDLLASAPTGTGKTASFVLPILQKLSSMEVAKHNKAHVLILTPTRELADQVYQNILYYSKYLKIRAAVVYGGVSVNPQMKILCRGTEIIVATPGRLLDLHQQNAIKFDLTTTLVLDEADRMLDMGFIHDIKRLIKLMPYKRQNLMFSATFSDEIRKLAKGILSEAIEIDVASRNVSAVAVKQTVHPVDKGQKTNLLSHLIHKNKWDQALVFSRTKHGANRLVKQLDEARIVSAAIHGNKSQSQRMKALDDFKNGKIQVLVATDIASRGIDISGLPCVINYDLPQSPEDYVHRIGRTGRAGALGLAISLVCADEADSLYSIEKLINKKIERIEIEEFEPVHLIPIKTSKTATKHTPDRGHAGRGRQGLNSRPSKTTTDKFKRR